MEAAHFSQIGPGKRINEDAVVSNDAAGLWAVCDGVGGHGRGDLASQRIAAALTEQPYRSSAQRLLNDVIERLERVHSGLADIPNSGSTVAILLAHGQKCAVIWSGDSRIYRWRHGILDQLTHDHSAVQQLIDAGTITAAEAETHPLRHVILSAIGGPEFHVDIHQHDLLPEDRFLLCTDGVYRLLTPDIMINTLTLPSPTKMVSALQQHLLQRGLVDDTSLLVLSNHPQSQ